MTATDVPHRRHFVDHSLLYVFSASIEFSIDLEQIGLVPEGARVNVLCVPESSRVFNVLRERTVGVSGYPAVTGALVSGEDTSVLREDDVAIANVRATFQTDDGAVIDATYQGVLPLGVGAFRDLAGELEGAGSEEEPAEFSIIVTPRYETADERYRWLTEQQCIGFGRVEVEEGLFRRVSYDVYAMM